LFESVAEYVDGVDGVDERNGKDEGSSSVHTTIFPNPFWSELVRGTEKTLSANSVGVSKAIKMLAGSMSRGSLAQNAT